MQGCSFLVKLGLVLIKISKVRRIKYTLVLLRKICSIHYLHLSFEKHVPSQVMKELSIEILETTPSTFLSKFYSEIYLSQIICY